MSKGFHLPRVNIPKCTVEGCGNRARCWLRVGKNARVPICIWCKREFPQELFDVPKQ
jgi:hypothetical protein